MIVRRGKSWCVLSEKTGRSFGCRATKKEAVKRLGQVEYFKRAKGRKA